MIPAHTMLTSEMIGRVSSNVYAQRISVGVTVDTTIPHYEFWGKLRRGKAKGYELGGLFAQPIGRITTSWAMGRGFSFVTDDDDANAELASFLAAEMITLMDWFYDSLTLGDAYLVVNSDGSLTPVPPNQMEVITDPLDYRKVVAYKIRTSLPGSITIEDEYRIDERIVRIKTPKSTEPQELHYANLIGMLPVIPLHNDREANEVYGHPVYESLLTLFAEYDDVIRKALDGVKVMGNPLIVVEGAENPEDEIRRLQSDDDATYTNANGNTEQTRAVVDFNVVPGDFIVLGKGAKLSFQGPGTFTTDAGKMLEFLFLLMLQHSKIPEWAWGGAISSSKASVDSQLPAFLLFIQSVQAKLEKPLLELAKVWLATRNLVVPISYETLAIQWNPLTDKNEQIVQAWVELLWGNGLITKATAVEASGLVEDAQAEVDAAEAEVGKAREGFESRVQQELEQEEELAEVA